MLNYYIMINLADDGYCFVCGPKNPVGLRLEFAFDGKRIMTRFVPRREHQGYMNIVHGGIISTLLDEAMVKLAIAMGMPAVTARLEIRLRKALKVGEEITVTAEITGDTKKILTAYARAVAGDNTIVADAAGKMLKVDGQEILIS